MTIRVEITASSGFETPPTVVVAQADPSPVPPSNDKSQDEPQTKRPVLRLVD